VAAVRQRARGWRYVAPAIASIALIAAGAVSARRWGGAAPAPVLYRLEAMTFDLGVTGHPAVSANGELLAYDSDRFDGTNFDIWVQPTGGGDPVRVTTDPADDTDPAFSPDGGRIAFRSEREGGGIYVVPALGGAERLLVPRGHSPRFSPDGKWLMYTTGGRGAAKDVFIMPAAGGTAQPVAPDYLVRSHGSWAADGTSIVFEGRKRGNSVPQSELYVVPVDGRGVSGPPRDTGLGPVIRVAGMVLQQTVGWDGRELLFVSSLGDGAGLWSARADGGAPAVRQVYGSTGGITGAVKASNGRLFFSGSTTRLSIASIPVTGARALATVPAELTRSVALEDWPSLSADGGQLAFRSSRYGGSVWVKDLKSGREMQLPVPGDAGMPVISPDGQQVAYAGPVSRVAVVNTRGGVPRDVCRDCGSFLSAWSPDGKYIIANSTSRDGNSHPMSIEVATGGAAAITTKGPAWFGRLSPDQRWLSFFEWPQPDRTREVIAPFRFGAPIDDAGRLPVTDGQSAAEEAAWSADGRTLYFVSDQDGFRCLYTVSFDPAAGRVTGAPSPLLHLHGTRRTMIDTLERPARIDVAGGRLVFSLKDVAGNVWSLTPQETAAGSVR
jgi:Tol biopolymer transport system component